MSSAQAPGPRGWSIDDPVSDAGWVAPDLSDEQWHEHLFAYFMRIKRALNDTERPIEAVLKRSPLGGHDLEFPFGPYVGDLAIQFPVGTPDAVIIRDGYGGYEVVPDSENDQPGFRMRPYLLTPGARLDDGTVAYPLPYGLHEGDEHEAAARIVSWILRQVR